MSVRLAPPVAPVPYTSSVSYPPGGPGFSSGSFGGEPEGVPWARYIEAFKRHIILILAIVGIGTALGIYAARRVKPVYDVEATVWIAAGVSQQTGPIR
ncbi:MAG TPA: hypothetical protein VGD02_11140, partial [Gemmatimonadaceae bacterium]